MYNEEDESVRWIPAEEDREVDWTACIIGGIYLAIVILVIVGTLGLLPD